MTTQTDTREFTITRTFDAPIELVFAAWTEPERMASWMGPEVFTTPVDNITLDVRPGGKWLAGMVHNETGAACPLGGEYREVDPPRRLVFTVGFSAAGGELTAPWPEPVEDSIVTIEFTEVKGKTEMSFHQIGQVEAEETKMRELGWRQAFEKLNNHLGTGAK